MKKLMLPKRYLILLALGGFIICLDQLLKIYFFTHIDHGDRQPVIDGFFYFTHVRNPGAAWGIFRDANESFRSIFFLLMPPAAVLIILYILHSVPDSDLAQTLALSGIFGGAIGNYIDRLRFGFVIDFLDFTFKYDLPGLGVGLYSYPAFNIADMAIVCGVMTLLYLMFRQSYLERKAAKA